MNEETLDEAVSRLIAEYGENEVYDAIGRADEAFREETAILPGQLGVFVSDDGSVTFNGEDVPIDTIAAAAQLKARFADGLLTQPDA